MIIVDVSDNGAIFTGGFIIFAAKSNYADGSDWKFASIVSMALDSSRSRSSIGIPRITVA
jgi:hypothetical protein